MTATRHSAVMQEDDASLEVELAQFMANSVAQGKQGPKLAIG